MPWGRVLCPGLTIQPQQNQHFRTHSPHHPDYPNLIGGEQHNCPGVGHCAQACHDQLKGRPDPICFGLLLQSTHKIVNILSVAEQLTSGLLIELNS